MRPDTIRGKKAIPADLWQDQQYGSWHWRKWVLTLDDRAALPAVLEIRPLLLAFALATGSVIYFLIPQEPHGYLFWIILTGMITGALGLCRGARPALALAALLFLGLVTGFGIAKTRTALVNSHMIAETYGPVMVEGWVTAVEPSAKGVRLRLSVHAVAGFDADSKPRMIRLVHMTGLKVAPGRFVQCWAVLRPPPGPAIPGDHDFKRQAWFEGLDAVGYVQGRCRGGALGAPASVWLQIRLELAQLQRKLAEYVNRAAGARAGGFAAALITGDRSYMPAADVDALRGSGLAHLLAISGLHMGILGGLVYLLLRRGLAIIEPLALRVPVQKPAALIAIIVCLAYLVLSGASVSTQRAFIMAAVVFGAILLDRPGLSIRSYAYAMMLIVLLRPESVLSPGFQMSFAATGILIAVYERWNARRRQIPQGWLSRPVFAVKSLIATSLVTDLAIAPYAVYHFQRVAGYGVLANLLAMPAVSLLSAPAAAITMIVTPLGLSEYGLRLFGFTLEFVLAIAHAFDGRENALQIVERPMPGLSLVFFSLALAVTISMSGRLRLAGSALAVSMAVLVWVFYPRTDIFWEASGDVVVRNAAGQLHRYEFSSGDGLGSLSLSELPEPADCSANPCMIATRQGSILLSHTPPDEALCRTAVARDIRLVLVSAIGPVPAGRTRTECRPIIYFADIRQHGGMSIRIKNSALEMRQPPKCDTRPWRRCAPVRASVVAADE